MKITIFEHQSLKINYADDLPKVVKYFKDHNIDIEFLPTRKTNIVLKNCPVNLYLPNDNKQQEILMYIFDRSQRSNSFAFYFSKTLKVIEVSTSTIDDTINYTWKLIAHEIMHCLFYLKQDQGFYLQDPMDKTLVNGQWIPYYNNEQPYLKDSNFGYAWKVLQTTYQYFSPTEVARWKLKPELWKILDDARALSGTAFIITSGFRTPQENLAVGGKPSSSHLRGLAADLLCIDNLKRTQMIRGILGCGRPVFLEIATKHLHIDIDSSIHLMGQTIGSADE